MTSAEADGTRAFYDLVAADYARLLPDTAFEAPLELGMFDHFVSLLPAADASVLDAGCGAGRMLGELVARGVRHVEGVDISPGMIAQAGAAHPDVPLTVGALDALPHDPARFDGVLAWYSIIHTPPHRCGPAFVEFARVLKPGGLVLLGYQSGTGERLVPGSAYGRTGTLPAFLHHTGYLREVLQTAGFDVIASADRSPRPAERHTQGVLLARRRD